MADIGCIASTCESEHTERCRTYNGTWFYLADTGKRVRVCRFHNDKFLKMGNSIHILGMGWYVMVIEHIISDDPEKGERKALWRCRVEFLPHARQISDEDDDDVSDRAFS